MKKIFIIILLAASLISPASAAEPGYAGEVNCQVWREGNPKPNTAGAPIYCKTNEDIFKRIYELEVLTDRLQQKNADLEYALSNGRNAIEADNRIRSLENRMTVVENSLSVLVENVMEVLRNVMVYISR